jgi:ribonuclease R
MADFALTISNLVSQPDYRPITMKAMSRRLKVPPDDYAEFRGTVKRLIQEGKLWLAKDKTLRLPDRTGMKVGTFRRSAKGFGFVRLEPPRGKVDQVYIPANATSDASTGDQVAIEITRPSRKAGVNPEGRIVRVLSRAAGLFVGTYFEAGDLGFVQIDGTTFREPISVGDPGAKGARPGDKVAIELVRYPSPKHEGEGVIAEILGQRGQPGVDTLSVIRAFNIPETFEPVPLEQAREQAKLFDEDEIGTRRDLRNLLTVTIDPATARDFDDAISLARDEQGHWSLMVHIADVAHFVRPGSPLDRAARDRGTSVYLPDRVIPMLPEIVSNSLASLQTGRTRYTVSAKLDFTPDGILTSKRFARSAIKVNHRFTYEQAFEVMKQPHQPHPGVAPEIAQIMGAMLELAMILRARRLKKGALELALPEIAIKLGDNGQVIGAQIVSHDESHQVIEEFMVAANEAVATTLSEHDIAFLRRAHPDPESFKLAEFAEFARSLGLTIEQPQSRFELQRILKETIGQPEEYAVHYGLLRSLKQATYTPEPEGHYALASQNYCHFTSPIRRYPDLQVHRQLIAFIEGKTPLGRHDELMALAQHCTRTERRAEAAERELIRMKLLAYLQDHVGEVFHAVIVGVEDFGLFCRISELPVDGLIHVTSLADDYYYLEPGTHTLVGRRSGRRHRLGDRERVRVARVDVDRRELDLVLVDSAVSRGHRGGAGRKPPFSRAVHLPPRARALTKHPQDQSIETPLTAGSKRPRPAPKRKNKTTKARKSGKKKRRSR